jgi:L-alanine-DL-glutamate epimerase-like enolase superfamily enzyme
MRLHLSERVMTLRAPLPTSYGALRDRRLFEVTISGGDAPEGHGEAAPLEPYDGVSNDLVRAALMGYASVVKELGDDATGPEIIDACRAKADLPQALAAIDLAVWDRAGKREGKSVAQLLAGDPLETVECSELVTGLEHAQRAVEAGFGTLKIKVGLGDDARTVAALRAALGDEVRLRLDANGAWSVETAVKAIGSLASAGLELVEEPVHGIAAMREVRERVPVRIAMDETVAEPGAVASGAADAVCLKISRSGGITPLLAQAALARTSGAEVYLGSTFDGPLGIAAAIHCAAALRCRTPCGLATASQFEGGAPAVPLLAVPSGPGLL